MKVGVKAYNVLSKNKEFYLTKIHYAGSGCLERFDKDKLLEYSRINLKEDTEKNWGEKKSQSVLHCGF